MLSSTFPISKTQHTVTFEKASEEIQNSTWTRLGKIVLFPFSAANGLYNLFRLYRSRDLSELLLQNINPNYWFTSFHFQDQTTELTETPPIARAMLEGPRADPENGLFNTTSHLFILLQRLYPKEKINKDDFLFTCQKDFVHHYRKPLIDLIGPNNIDKHTNQLKDTAKDVIKYFVEKSPNSPINATQLARTYATTIISKLLLDRSPQIESSAYLANAIALFMNSWSHPQEMEQENDALEIMQQALLLARLRYTTNPSDSLVGKLQGKNEMQINSTILAAYAGGTETTGALLSYLLWQLGNHPEYQEKILEEFNTSGESTSLKEFFAESIRLFTPIFLIDRTAAHDLVCTVKDEEGEVVYKQTIPKETTIAYSPAAAGRNPFEYADPNTFNPKNVAANPEALPWLPFGHGFHTCPGQALAKAEIFTLVTTLLEQYKIKSLSKEEPKRMGLTTLTLNEDIELVLEKR